MGNKWVLRNQDGEYWVDYETREILRKKGIHLPVWGKLEHAVLIERCPKEPEKEIAGKKGIWVINPLTTIASVADFTLDEIQFAEKIIEDLS